MHYPLKKSINLDLIIAFICIISGNVEMCRKIWGICENNQNMVSDQSSFGNELLLFLTNGVKELHGLDSTGFEGVEL